MPLPPSLPSLDSVTHHFNTSPCAYIPCPSVLPSYLSGKIPILNLCWLRGCSWMLLKKTIRLSNLSWGFCFLFFYQKLQVNLQCSTAWKSTTFPEIMWGMLGEGIRLQEEDWLWFKWEREKRDDEPWTKMVTGMWVREYFPETFRGQNWHDLMSETWLGKLDNQLYSYQEPSSRS